MRGYRSKIDGSVQPYGMVIPDNYSGSSSRLDFWCHGRGETLTELAFLKDRRANIGQLPANNRLVLHLYGRYCCANKFAGEVDLFEALAHARSDPELAKWLAEQTAFDAVISAKLQSVPVPRDLKATILAGRKVIPVRPQPWWRRSLHPAAVAAALAITFGTIGLFAFHEPPEARADFTRFTEDLTDYLLEQGLRVRYLHSNIDTVQRIEILRALRLG